jgi:GLPGLI family protein
MQDETEDIFYKNLNEKIKIHQKGIMGKSFIVEDALETMKWKITNEKIKYLDYECQKAVIEDENQFVVAWFTSQIPVQAGPAGYHGLPGMILLVNVNDGETEYKATKMDLRTLEKSELSKPKKGKKVSEEEFEAIRAQKEKEMEQQYGGHQRRIRQ